MLSAAIEVDDLNEYTLISIKVDPTASLQLFCSHECKMMHLLSPKCLYV